MKHGIYCCVIRTKMYIVNKIFKLEYLILFCTYALVQKKDKGCISEFLTLVIFLSLVCWIDYNLSADCDFKLIVP